MDKKFIGGIEMIKKISLVVTILLGFAVADGYKTIQRKNMSHVQKFKRVALVIGNNDYENGHLTNAVSDARAISEFLDKKRFQKIVYAENANEKTMRDKVQEFLNSLDNNSLGFVYFSGHGIQEYSQKYNKTINYLIPIDNSKLQSVTDLDYNTVSLNYILDSLSEKNSGFNIVLLDACRTPFKAFSKSTQEGLAQSSAKGVYIAYATADGERALDNGLFRKSFIKYAKQPIKLIEILEKVKTEVYDKSKQFPFVSNNKRGTFYFTEPIDTSLKFKSVNLGKSWIDANRYCQNLNLRLPSVEELLLLSNIKFDYQHNRIEHWRSWFSQNRDKRNKLRGGKIFLKEEYLDFMSIGNSFWSNDTNTIVNFEKGIIEPMYADKSNFVCVSNR